VEEDVNFTTNKPLNFTPFCWLTFIQFGNDRIGRSQFGSVLFRMHFIALQRRTFWRAFRKRFVNNLARHLGIPSDVMNRNSPWVWQRIYPDEKTGKQSLYGSGCLDLTEIRLRSRGPPAGAKGSDGNDLDFRWNCCSIKRQNGPHYFTPPFAKRSKRNGQTERKLSLLNGRPPTVVPNWIAFDLQTLNLWAFITGDRTVERKRIKGTADLTLLPHLLISVYREIPAAFESGRLFQWSASRRFARSCRSILHCYCRSVWTDLGALEIWK
jgi:hypothetical protein